MNIPTIYNRHDFAYAEPGITAVIDTERLYNMDMFYGEPIIQELIDKSKLVLEEIESQENEKKYVKTYRRNYSLISSLNKIFPSFLQNYISIIVLKRIG